MQIVGIQVERSTWFRGIRAKTRHDPTSPPPAPQEGMHHGGRAIGSEAVLKLGKSRADWLRPQPFVPGRSWERALRFGSRHQDDFPPQNDPTFSGTSLCHTNAYSRHQPCKESMHSPARWSYQRRRKIGSVTSTPTMRGNPRGLDSRPQHRNRTIGCQSESAISVKRSAIGGSGQRHADCADLGIYNDCGVHADERHRFDKPNKKMLKLYAGLGN